MVIRPAWSNTTRSTESKIINLRAYDKIYKKKEKKKIFFSPNFCSFFISAVLLNHSSVEQIIPERNPTSTNSKLDTDLQMYSTTYVTVN